MNKREECVEYLKKCVVGITDVVNFKQAGKEEIGIILDAWVHVLCCMVQAAGINKEKMILNVARIWDEIEVSINPDEIIN